MNLLEDASPGREITKKKIHGAGEMLAHPRGDYRDGRRVKGGTHSPPFSFLVNIFPKANLAQVRNGFHSIM